MSFLFLPTLSSVDLTEDGEVTAASGPDEAIRLGGVMEGLLLPITSSKTEYHFQDAAVTSPSSVPTPVCGHLRSYKNLKAKYQDQIMKEFKFWGEQKFCPQASARSQKLSEVVGHPGTSLLLFFEYYEFGHTTRLAYCFSHTI